MSSEQWSASPPAGTRRRGDAVTRRRKIEEGVVFSVSPCLRVSASRCLRVSVSPRLRVSMSPCLMIFRFPLLWLLFHRDHTHQLMRLLLLQRILYAVHKSRAFAAAFIKGRNLS